MFSITGSKRAASSAAAASALPVIVGEVDGSRKRSRIATRGDSLSRLDKFRQLRDQGFQVVPGVFESEEALEAGARVKDDIEAFNGHNNANGRKLRSLHQGMYQHYGLAWLRSVIKVRMDPKTIGVFERLYKGENLLSSFDGLMYRRADAKFNHKTGQQWLHIDQGHKMRGFQCVQGFVALTDIPESGSTLVVLKNSHLYHDEFMDTFVTVETVERKRGDQKMSVPKRDTNWVKLSQAEIEWFLSKPGVEEVRVPMNAGDMVLWDSRTVHYGGFPTDDAGKQDCVKIYTCFTPCDWATTATLKRKRKCVEDGASSNHWPHLSQRFSTEPPMFRVSKGVRDSTMDVRACKMIAAELDAERVEEESLFVGYQEVQNSPYAKYCGF